VEACCYVDYRSCNYVTQDKEPREVINSRQGVQGTKKSNAFGLLLGVGYIVVMGGLLLSPSIHLKLLGLVMLAFSMPAELIFHYDFS